MKVTVLGSRVSSQNIYMNPVASNQDDLIKLRKEGLLNFSSTHMNESTKPILSATTDTQIMELELTDRKAKNSPLSMVLQPIDIDTKLSGSVRVDSDQMEMELLSASGNPAELIDEMVKDYIFSETDYTQTWKLPEDFVESVDNWSKLQLFGVDANRYEVSLFNVKTGSYEQVEAKTSPIIEPANEYVTEDGKVLLKLKFNDRQLGEASHPPELRLTGEVEK